MFKRTMNRLLTPSMTVQPKILYDQVLLFVALAIVVMGLLMVASSSIVMSEKQYGWPFYYLVHQAIYMSLGGMLATVIFFVKIETLERYSAPTLLIVLMLLCLVLIPGIGKQVNGSSRWLGIGPVVVQVSEIAKFAMVIYLASYLLRHQAELHTIKEGFLKPMGLMILMGGLLILEPDFGATVVMMATGLAMMFLAGVRVRQFVCLLIIVIAIFALLAIASPYRLARLTSFLNPWTHQYGSGYQLTQSLIAFGRGGWLGVGLGNSIQKLFYLPEAHTDFLFAILAEELGLMGACIVILLYMILIYRALIIARRAIKQGFSYAALVAFGFAVWLAIQVIVNIGVNTGLLPTKGLTLPLMSYGGSSIMIDIAVIAFLLRIDYEVRLQTFGVRSVEELKTRGD